MTGFRRILNIHHEDSNALGMLNYSLYCYFVINASRNC